MVGTESRGFERIHGLLLFGNAPEWLSIAFERPLDYLSRGSTPLNFIKFLDHCAKLIILKKVGGGYIFIHRMLLDYFADIPRSILP